MTPSNYTEEDLTTREAIGAVIYDNEGRVLIQDHVKLNFFTIPIGKLKTGDNPEEIMKGEVLDETNIRVRDSKVLTEQEGEYDYDGVKIRIKTKVFEVISWEGELMNTEPKKHRWSRFMSIEEIKKLEPISDATRFFLSTLDKQ